MTKDMRAEHFAFLWDTIIDGRYIFKKLMLLHHRQGDASRAVIETIKSVNLSSRGPHILDISFHIYVPQRERVVWIRQQQNNKPLQSDTCDLMRKVRNIFPDAMEVDRIFKDRFGFSLTLRDSNMWEMFVEFMFCRILSKTAPWAQSHCMSKSGEEDECCLSLPWSQVTVSQSSSTDLIYLDESQHVKRVVHVDNFDMERFFDHPFMDNRYPWESTEYFLDYLFHNSKNLITSKVLDQF